MPISNIFTCCFPSARRTDPDTEAVLKILQDGPPTYTKDSLTKESILPSAQNQAPREFQKRVKEQRMQIRAGIIRYRLSHPNQQSIPSTLANNSLAITRDAPWMVRALDAITERNITIHDYYKPTVEVNNSERLSANTSQTQAKQPESTDASNPSADILKDIEDMNNRQEDLNKLIEDRHNDLMKIINALPDTSFLLDISKVTHDIWKVMDDISNIRKEQFKCIEDQSNSMLKLIEDRNNDLIKSIKNHHKPSFALDDLEEIWV